ncbi:hypothetical protein [Pelagibacterium montanilacus]|uniref:hypothetical protein n=1 Tax=Pelagibacterium montanilacus TaxID=2185280 RepID=UPI000F8E182B|nr:hypothetical protein [Pelagibacterium montanilacus]
MNVNLSLENLKVFKAGSPLASEDNTVRDKALLALQRSLLPQRAQRRKVSDLLSVVLALSARTRRMILPRIEVDIDVFSPAGKRAVRMHFGREH